MSIFDFSDFDQVAPVEETLNEAGQVMSDFYDEKIRESMIKPNPMVKIVQRDEFFNCLREYPTLKWWQFLRKRYLEREIARLAIIVVPEMVKKLPQNQITRLSRDIGIRNRQ